MGDDRDRCCVVSVVGCMASAMKIRTIADILNGRGVCDDAQRMVYLFRVVAVMAVVRMWRTTTSDLVRTRGSDSLI